MEKICISERKSLSLQPKLTQNESTVTCMDGAMDDVDGLRSTYAGGE